ncbi:MAG: hypothetical protein LAO77_05035 [Acidobacteriia bacterium]|nr:hypothetical protein [Terriglobia bacterium]
MTKRLPLLAFVLAAACPLSGSGQRAAEAPTTPTGPAALSDFFKPGVVFQDRNNDGVVDFVDARLVMPEHPTTGELAAAADVAARLGFETSAMNLPVARADVARGFQPSGTGASIFIGVKSLAPSGVSVQSLGGGTLKAGDGFVAAFTIGRQPAVAVLGGDDDGLNAAAVSLAGHLPYVWDQKSATVDKIAADVKQWLAGKGVTPTAVTTPAIYVKSNVDGAERIVVDAQMAAGDLVKAQVALNQFKATGGTDPKRALAYANVRSLRIRLRAQGGGVATVDLPGTGLPAPTVGDPSPVQPPARRPGGGAKDNFDLSSFYANEGALADSDNNLIPDRVDVLLSADGDGADGVVDLAARLGLESTGVSLPIAKPATALTAPDGEPMLVLIGVNHPTIEQLIKNHKWERPALQPGEGLIQLVKKAFGEKSALIVTGGDAAGVDRAVHQLAEKFPHIWARGKDRTTLDDVEEDLRKFVAGRSPAGQAAMSLYKLDKLAEKLQGKDLSSAHVKVFVEKAADGLADVVRQEAAAKLTTTSPIAVDVQNLDVQKGRALVTDDFDIPSEVDEFWTKLRTRVIPALKAVKKRQAVTIDARLSEPPEVRREIAQKARVELIAAGADEKATTVTVLSAYKQGYSWLYDVVRPALAGRPVDRITIKFAELGPPGGWKQQGMFAPSRWLLEIYPIDEILSQELKIDLKKIHFEMTPIGSASYEVIASAANGSELLRRRFEPAVVERAFFDRFPDYEHVRVTTGWIKAGVADRTVVDDRIETDPERFWDHFQAKTLPALYDHVMALGNGKPRADDAPFFGELTVDLTLSEPEYRLPIDEEQISSMEALHEEIYFNTIRVSRPDHSDHASEGRRQGRPCEDHRDRLRCRSSVRRRRVR